MNLNPQRREWFFPIEEAPLLAVVTHKGVARDLRVPNKKALIAADTGHIVLSSNTMTDIASRPPPSPRFRRNRPSLERRAGAWLRDFRAATVRPGFSVAAHLAELAARPQSDRLVRR
jgi:hypothetical protein